MEPTERAFELSKMSSVAPRVGSTKFMDTALVNDFIACYSVDEFREEEVKSGEKR